MKIKKVAFLMNELGPLDRLQGVTVPTHTEEADDKTQIWSDVHDIKISWTMNEKQFIVGVPWSRVWEIEYEVG